jgi:hypothetical protein
MSNEIIPIGLSAIDSSIYMNETLFKRNTVGVVLTDSLVDINESEFEDNDKGIYSFGHTKLQIKKQSLKSIQILKIAVKLYL